MSLLTSAATRSGRTVWAGCGPRWGRRIDQGLGDERGGNGEVLTTDDTDHTDLENGGAAEMMNYEAVGIFYFFHLTGTDGAPATNFLTNSCGVIDWGL